MGTNKDMVSLEEIYQEYYPKVTGLVYKKVGDRDAVEDLVEDIFLKIAQNLDRYDPDKASLSTWIYTIASRMIMDYYRGRRLFLEIPNESGEEGSLPEVLVDDKALDANLLLEEQLELLAEGLTQLKQKERDIVILYYYKDITLKEAAQVMGMSYANAKVLHKKALNKLHKVLAAS